MLRGRQTRLEGPSIKTFSKPSSFHQDHKRDYSMVWLKGFLCTCVLEKENKKEMALPGIEPGLARPQRDVIPLDHSTLTC